MSVATDLTIVRNYCSRTDAQTLRLADALVRLSVAGQSVRDITTAIADTAAPIGRNRIAVIVKTRKAHPDADDVTFAAALKDATAANTGARVKPEPVTTDDAVSPQGTASAVVTAALADPTPVTVDTLTDALASLFEQARLLTDSDRVRFLAAVDAEVAFSTPVTIAVPVAA